MTKVELKKRAHKLALKYRDAIIGSSCEGCGRTDGPLHMHHEDYDRALDIVTLCKKCHFKLHLVKRQHGIALVHDSYTF